jgi:uncharacterized protein (DUF4415 family)
MRKEYDLKKLKLKRKGILPELEGKDARQAKVRITISLDQDIVDYFKRTAEEKGNLPYQTQINQALRKAIEVMEHEDIEALKEKLLKDPDFIKKLAETIKAA